MPTFNYQQAKQDGYSDQEIADYLSQRKASGVDIWIDKNEYAKATQTPVEAKTSVLQKVGKVAEEKFLSPLTNTFVAPVAKELERPFVSAVRGVQRLIPGGKTGKEPVKTPFGEVKPYSELSVGESAMGAVDVASFLPVEKLFTGTVKVASKVGKSLLTKGGEILTGIPKENLSKWFNIAKSSPEKMNVLKEIIQENPKEPFLGLADRIGVKLNALKEQAGKAFTTAKTLFEEQTPFSRFDVSNKVDELRQPLEEFGITLKLARDKAGKVTKDLAVQPKGKITDFNTKEIGIVQDLVNTVRNAKGFTLDDLIALRGKFARAYDAVPLGLDGQPTKYHALIKSLENTGESIIHEALPDSLKVANKMYQEYWDVYNKIGRNILDASGKTKQGAETFLGNITNLNKGASRRTVEEAGKKLGMDIVGTSDNLKIAKELSESVPSTVKNRTVDMLRALLTSNVFSAGATGAGIATGNLAAAVPAVIINILARPNVYANLIEGLAKTSAKIPVTQIIKNLNPEELVLLQQILQKPATAPFRPKETNERTLPE